MRHELSVGFLDQESKETAPIIGRENSTNDGQDRKCFSKANMLSLYYRLLDYLSNQHHGFRRTAAFVIRNRSTSSLVPMLRAWLGWIQMHNQWRFYLTTFNVFPDCNRFCSALRITKEACSGVTVFR